MIIREIEWLSKEAEEAVLFVIDGEYECIVFSHPCTYQKGEQIDVPFFAINVKGIQKEEQDTKLAIKKQSESLSQFIIAKVIDRNSNLVMVGNIIIELDDSFPGDIEINDIISFSCNRVDAF